MRLPIKLNQAGWPSRFARLSFAFHDPRPLANEDYSHLAPLEFSRAISTLQFGVTFKTTRPGRQAHSNQFISQIYRESKPVILDVGASDGSTSLDLIRSLVDFGHYFVTISIFRLGTGMTIEACFIFKTTMAHAYSERQNDFLSTLNSAMHFRLISSPRPCYQGSAK